MSMSNNQQYDVIIIGGGAGGLFCACLIKSRGPEKKVAILEKQDRVGKKLLVTGNGRCNMTNINITADMYHGSFKNGAAELLNMCPPQMIVELFEDFGILTTVDLDGRVYPKSRQANSVLDTLRLSCQNLGVDIYCDSYVSEMKPNKNGITVKSNDKVFSTQNIVVATGSKSSPSTGADDSILNVLEKLGHKKTALYPALCPVFVKSPYLRSLKGVRSMGSASIIKDGKVLRAEQGEIQFTENALSGICLFNLSRIANTEKNTQISLSLLPEYSFNEILNLLHKKKSTLNKASKAEDLFIGFFNKALGIALLKEAGISPSSEIISIHEKDLKNLAKIINDWRFDVLPGIDFSRSQVTAGGIHGSEIDPTTMKSKKIKDMYIIGEAIDCDGDCGGMNLQFAFSSAYCAACDLTK